MKKLILAALIIATTYTAHAQVALGLEGGLNFANYIQKTENEKRNSDYVSGARISLLIDGALGGHCFLQSGLMYVEDGTKFTIHDQANNPYILCLNVNTLALPINFIYKTGKPKHGHFFLGGGIYLGANFGGTSRTFPATIFNRPLKFGSESTDDLKRVDIGGILNIGYQTKSRLFVRASYHMGFTNLNPTGTIDGAVTVKNSNIGLTVGYLFHQSTKRVTYKKPLK